MIRSPLSHPSTLPKEETLSTIAPEIRLSKAQKQVVDHRGNHLQVIACAGSGKTESVSRRIAALIKEGEEPASIIAFTFTEKAAAELKDRVARRVAEEMGPEFLGRLGPMFVGTIHGYCFRLLQDYVPGYGNYDVLDPHKHAALLSREHDSIRLKRLGEKHSATIAGFQQTVDVISNELIDVEDLKEIPLYGCLKNYRELLERYRFLTFGDQIERAVEALADPEIYGRVHGPLRHLIVDEYQDINPAQERLIQLLGQPPVEVCVVGDDDQSIYQWRGSDTSNIITFENRWPAVKKIELVKNRRSRQQIIKLADHFARSISPRLEKKMEPHRPPADVEIVPWSAETAEEEAERIADTVKKLKEKGFRYSDIAVLYRSVRTSGPLLIQALRDRDVPLSCGGRTGLFLQPEVEVLAHLYMWLIGHDWRDTPWSRSYNIKQDQLIAGLERSFSDGQAILRLETFLDHWKKQVPAKNQPANLVGDLYKLLNLLKVQEWDLENPLNVAKLGGIARFSEILADFESVTRRAGYQLINGKREWRGGLDRGRGYYWKLANFIVHYARDAYEDFEGEETIELDTVDIMTVHQAKGLEWPIVFMPALTAKRFPSSNAGRSQDWLLPEEVFPPESRNRYEGGDTEERRLFYVALTRARDCLYLSTFQRIKNAQKASPYLTELFDEFPDFDPLPLPAAKDAASVSELPPQQFSFSDVAMYQECPHQYRLSRSFGFQPQPGLEFGYGRAVHHVMRHIAEFAQQNKRVPDPEEIEEILQDQFHLPFARPAPFRMMYRAAGNIVKRYIQEWSDDLKRIWAVERQFEIHDEGGILTGRADVILEERRGRPDALALVDYKTSTDERRDEIFHFQLAIYAAAGRGEGLDVSRAFLHDLRNQNRKNVDVSDPATAEAVERASKHIRGIRRGEFRPQPEEARCGMCDYRHICREAARNPLDLDFTTDLGHRAYG